jgi:hypothetical protein
MDTTVAYGSKQRRGKKLFEILADKTDIAT